MDYEGYKAATIAVVGRTNAGKSTLVNRLVGEKVSIVSPVEQTTRNRVRAILSEEHGQLVFLDTPGLHKAESELGTLMNKMARGTGDAGDILMIVFDGANPVRQEDEGWMRRAIRSDAPIFLVLNKQDCVAFDGVPFRQAWENVIAELGAPKSPVVWWELSADEGSGCEELKAMLFDCAPDAPGPLFPEDIVSDFPRKLAIADIIREKLIKRLYQEVPHELGVRVDRIDEKEDGSWHIGATIFVNRAAQKGMVIGVKGRTLRAMRRSAEPEIAEAYGLSGCTIEPFVRVEPKWFRNHFLLKELGYKE